MPIRIVQSRQNPRLKELRRILETPGRKTSAFAAIEGPHLIEEAKRAGLHFRCVFVEERLRNWVEASGLSHETEVLVVPSGILSPILSTETPQPVAALVAPPDWTLKTVLDRKAVGFPLVIVLAGIQDPGNLGTIVRSADAFSASGVICLPGTVNSWNPKAVRASAGSIFRVPIVNAGESEAFEQLRKAGVRIFSTAVDGGQPANESDLASPFAIVIGNEGSGIPPNLTSQADAQITIPCPGPAESLNAAVAASVLLYEATRQRALAETRGGTR
jgi:TrmH family RNA methyltransferase